MKEKAICADSGARNTAATPTELSPSTKKPESTTQNVEKAADTPKTPEGHIQSLKKTDIPGDGRNPNPAEDSEGGTNRN